MGGRFQGIYIILKVHLLTKPLYSIQICKVLMRISRINLVSHLREKFQAKTHLPISKQLQYKVLLRILKIQVKRIKLVHFRPGKGMGWDNRIQ